MLQSPLEEVDFVDIYIGSSEDLNLYHLSTSNPHLVGSDNSPSASVAAKPPALCKPLPSPKSTFFFSGGETRPRPTGRPVAGSPAQLGRLFWCVFVPPSKNGRNNEQKPPNQGRRPLKNDLKISPWEFYRPKFEVSQDVALKKPRPWAIFQTDADFLSFRKRRKPP